MMKVIIKVGNGWRGSLVECMECRNQFTYIRSCSAHLMDIECPVCRKKALFNLETPWVGLIEKVVE